MLVRWLDVGCEVESIWREGRVRTAHRIEGQCFVLNGNSPWMYSMT